MIPIYKLSATAGKTSHRTNPRLIFHSADVLLLGGFSLLVLLAIRLSGIHLNLNSSVWWGLIYVTSFPHFMASQFLFYGEKHLLRAHRKIAYGVPIALFVILTVAVCSNTRAWIVLLARVAYAWLFWHLAKQAFGASVWMGGAELRGAKANLPVKTCLKYLCYLVASYGYVASQLGMAPVISFGIYVPSLGVGEGCFSVMYLMTGVALAAFGILCLLENVSVLSLLPILALFTWLQPDAFRTGTFLLVPIFHGLQYFPFFHSKVTTETAGGGYSLLWWVCLALIGSFLFLGVPHLLTETIPFSSPERIAPAILLFFNLHHFLVDSILWKTTATRGKLAQ